jgi:cysteine desulfurase family protein
MSCIYLDNAASSWPKPDAMIQAMVRFNADIGANPGRSGHRLSIAAARVVFAAREGIARLLGAPDPGSIVFTRNGTEALNLAIQGLLRPGDHVITSGMEHNSVMRPLREVERRGVAVSVVPCSPAGCLDPGDVARAIRPATRALFVTHASNVTGTLMPIEALAGLARDHGLHLCVDAAQTAGCVPIDVERSGIAILCFTGHKSLYGPQGTGGLYLRKGLESQVRPLLLGGTGSRSESEDQPEFMPDRFEAGTPNTIGLAGLGAGVAHVLAAGVEAIREREVRLAGLLLEGLADLPGVTVSGPPEPDRRTAIVSFVIDGQSPSDTAFELDEGFGILTRPGLHCAPAAHRTLGTAPTGTVRCSLGLFTSEAEVLETIRAVRCLAARAGRA